MGKARLQPCCPLGVSELFGAFVLSKKYENHLVNFQIHKNEVIIALFPIAVEKEVNWKFNCCFFEVLKGSLRIVSLSMWFADEL